MSKVAIVAKYICHISFYVYFLYWWKFIVWFYFFITEVRDYKAMCLVLKFRKSARAYILYLFTNHLATIPKLSYHILIIWSKVKGYNFTIIIIIVFDLVRAIMWYRKGSIIINQALLSIVYLLNWVVTIVPIHFII